MKATPRIFLAVALSAALAFSTSSCGHGGGGGGGDGGADTQPPTVISTSPANGATDVAVNTSVSATFSEAMDPATINPSTFTLKDNVNNPVSGTVSYSGTTATFTPDTHLAYSATYTATITTGVTDLAGNVMTGDYSFTFTTGIAPDTTPPTVISTSPAGGATDIAVNTSISATFSEAMDPATINPSTFTLKDNVNNPVSGTVSYSGTIATFTPDADFAYSTTYTATITTGVKDLAGNAILSDNTWTFTTEASSTFTVIKSGTGSGTVTSTPGGIDCGTDCSETYAYGTDVTLTATPEAGFIFEGFSGGCSSIKPTCTLTLTGDETVTAIFNTSFVSAAGNQLGLDGTDDVAVHEQVSNPPTSALDLSTFTIEAWIYPLGDSNMIIVADSAYYLMVKPQPLRVEFAVMTSTGFPASLSFSGTTNPLKLNQWNHVVGMVDNSTKKLQIAVNGEMSGTLTMGGTVDVSYPQTFSVGNSYPQILGDYPFIGRIDEVRLSSVIRYYSGNFIPSSLLDPDGSTAGLWHFDEAEGATTFADSSGNGNTLTGLGGAATIAGTRTVTAVASGSLVPGFGSGGVVTSNPSFYDDAPWTVLIDDNALYVVGGDGSVGEQWRIEKRNLTTGALVTSFGNGGVVTSNPSIGYDAATAAVSDGTNLYVVGYDMVPSFGDYEWRIEKRLLSTGELVTAFGNNGAVTNNPSTSGDIPKAVVTDGTYLYVVGYDFSPGNAEWRIEKRSVSTGMLDANFGTGGVVTTDVSTSWDVASSAVIHDTSLYIIGWVSIPSGYQWRIEKRSLDTGALVTDFGTNGVVSSSPPAVAQPSAALTDGIDLYIAGYGSVNQSGDWQWYIEKRNLSTGALVPTFGTGGIVSSNPSSGDDEAHALMLDGGSLYVVGDDESLGGFNLQWRIEKRSLGTGALVADFGTGGVVTSNPSSNSGGFRETANAVVSDGTSLYVVGVDYSPGNSQWRIEKRAAIDHYTRAIGGQGHTVFLTSNEAVLALRQPAAEPQPSMRTALVSATLGFVLAGGGLAAVPLVPVLLRCALRSRGRGRIRCTRTARGLFITIPAVLLFLGNSQAQGDPGKLWGPDGAAVTTAPGNQLGTAAVSDGGGAIFVWTDYRTSSGTSDLFGQRISADGVSLWEMNGTPIITALNVYGEPALQYNVNITSDAIGGAILTWEDDRNLQGDIYAQRIDANGNAHWQANGIPISTACWQAGPPCANYKHNPQIATDGAGGAIITWWEIRDGVHLSVWAQRVDADGQPLWATDGVPVAAGPFYADFPKIISDGNGGAIIAWQDSRMGIYGIYAQRLNGNGVPQWPTNGIEVSPTIAQRGLGGHTLISDGAGGAIIAWVDGRSDPNDANIYAQRLNAGGLIQWQADGIPIVTRPRHQYSPTMATDGAGGAVITWEDQGASPLGSGQQWILAQRVNSLGVAQWIENGILICSSCHGFGPQIVSDGAGGAIIVWDEFIAGPAIRAQRVNGTGGMLWALNGFEVYVQPGGNYGFGPKMVSDGAGGAIINWIVNADTTGGFNLDVSAQRVTDQFSTFFLTVTKGGTGNGAVTSSPAGIDCGTTCTASYNSGPVVTLTATPAGDSMFTGWSGHTDCSDGQITMNADKTCTATFTSTVPDITVTDSVPPVTDLQLLFGDVTAGNVSDQTVTVTNNSSVDLVIGNVAGANPLDAPFSIINDTCSGLTIAPSGNCTIGVRFLPTITGLFSDAFDVPSNDPDENPVTVSVNGIVAAARVADLSITKTDSPDPVLVGNNLAYTVTVTNQGPDTATDVILTEILPRNITFVSSSPSQGVCGNVERVGLDNKMACTLGTVNNGGTATIVIVIIPTVSLGFVSNTASVTASTATDPNLTNNSSTVQTTVLSSITNNPPSIPELVFPANGQTSLGTAVTFRWKQSQDLDGDTVTYDFYYCKDPSFTGCSPIVVASLWEKDIDYVAAGAYGAGLLLFGVVLATGVNGRKRIALLIAMIIVTGAMLGSCSRGGGGGDGAPSGPSDEVTHTISGLETSTTYYWKVIADDGNGGTSESETRSFTTQ